MNVQNVNCDNQETALLYQCPVSEKFSLIPSSRMHSMDLMGNIQYLINDRLVKILSVLLLNSKPCFY